jgi:hypothetical protein
MSRVSLGLMLLLCACGAESKPECPTGYVSAPLNMCTVDRSAPPCECFQEAPWCCAGDACIGQAACHDGVWKCEPSWHLAGSCSLPDVPARRD